MLLLGSWWRPSCLLRRSRHLCAKGGTSSCRHGLAERASKQRTEEAQRRANWIIYDMESYDMGTCFICISFGLRFKQSTEGVRTPERRKDCPKQRPQRSQRLQVVTWQFRPSHAPTRRANADVVAFPARVCTGDGTFERAWC